MREIKNIRRIEESGKRFFATQDVAPIFGFQNTFHIRYHVPDSEIIIKTRRRRYGNRQVAYISEDGLQSLVRYRCIKVMQLMYKIRS